MGLQDLISYLSIGDEILFTHDQENIFIYNLSKSTNYEIEENIHSQIDMNTLQNRARNINPRPQQVQQTIYTYPRNNTLKNYVKRRSNYSCEMPNCNYQGFNKENGETYIEVHHVIPLSESGEDSIYNTVALCPNCHRALHYANNREELREILLNYLRNV
jgi:5-methylcytosine-specific restriction endonuclease McrA